MVSLEWQFTENKTYEYGNNNFRKLKIKPIIKSYMLVMADTTRIQLKRFMKAEFYSFYKVQQSFLIDYLKKA
jgi:hypothetical protein